MTEKGMRKGITKEDILQLTAEEKKQIEAQRKFNDVEKGTKSYYVLATIDRIRRQVRENKFNIDTSVAELMNLEATIKRNLIELESGNITTELKPGVLMSKEELEWNIRVSKNLANTVVFNIPMLLADLREVIGYRDVKGDIVMTEEEFDKYVDEVENEVKKLGHQLLF